MFIFCYQGHLNYVNIKQKQLFFLQQDRSPYDQPGTVVGELGQTINKYAIKKIEKVKNLYRILVSGKFSTNLYVKRIVLLKQWL